MGGGIEVWCFAISGLSTFGLGMGLRDRVLAVECYLRVPGVI